MNSRKTNRQGFTLVELLTVIIIIAILAGMVTGAVGYAVTSVKQAAIRAEIGSLEQALNAYKADIGEYPPDNSTDATRHIQACYRNATTTTTYATVTPTTALYIFLGPHNANPRSPFSSTSGKTTKGYFEFDKNRVDSYQYYPSGGTVPYVYFRANLSKEDTSAYDGKSWNGVSAYYNNTQNSYFNPKTFQIISAGLDNEYGSTFKFSTDTGRLDEATGNNIVNFSTKLIKDLLE
ncbi:MAG: type II secretion system protein [Planctomycetia bacterium]|nr:type II secretion system protein [Planctomycetia bacterium]